MRKWDDLRVNWSGQALVTAKPIREEIFLCDGNALDDWSFDLKHPPMLLSKHGAADVLPRGYIGLFRVQKDFVG